MRDNTKAISSFGARKSTSTQKQRLSSSKLTTGILNRDNASSRGFRSTDKLFMKRGSNNSHALKNPSKRPATASSKKHNFVHKPIHSEYKQNNENFNRTINNKRGSEAMMSSNNRLKKQKSTGFNHKDPLLSSKTPNVMKRKAELLNVNTDNKHRQLNDDLPNDSSYTTEGKDKRYNKQRNSNNDDSSSSITTPLSDAMKGRVTATPSRYGIKSRCKVFKIEPEAFQPMPGLEDQNLIVNLEDIVKEEQVIFTIQE